MRAVAGGVGLLDSPAGVAGYALAVAAVLLFGLAQARRQAHPVLAKALAALGAIAFAMGLALILLA